MLSLQPSSCIIHNIPRHRHHILITNLPILSLPLQEEKWRAVLPLSSAAQGSMSSCRSFRTGRTQLLLAKHSHKSSFSHPTCEAVSLHPLTAPTCVDVVAVGCLPQSFYSCGDKRFKVTGRYVNDALWSKGGQFAWHQINKGISHKNSSSTLLRGTCWTDTWQWY